MYASKVAIATQCARSILEDPGVHPHFVSLWGVANTTVVLCKSRDFPFNRGAAGQPPIPFSSQQQTQ